MEELFWKVLPEYLAIGMSAEEFWHGDLRLCKAYREAYSITVENKYVAEWRSGVYMFEALLSAANAYREFQKTSDHPYPEKPLFSTERAKKIAEEQEEKARMERNKAVFTAFAAKFNARFEQGE